MCAQPLTISREHHCDSLSASRAQYALNHEATEQFLALPGTRLYTKMVASFSRYPMFVAQKRDESFKTQCSEANQKILWAALDKELKQDRHEFNLLRQEFQLRKKKG